MSEKDNEPCPFFMKTGTCKFGNNCRFIHQQRRGRTNGAELNNNNKKPPSKPPDRRAETKNSGRPGTGGGGNGGRDGAPAAAKGFKSNNNMPAAAAHGNMSSNNHKSSSSSSSSAFAPHSTPEDIMSPDLNQFRSIIFAKWAAISKATGASNRKTPVNRSGGGNVSRFDKVIDGMGEDGVDKWRALWSVASKGVFRRSSANQQAGSGGGTDDPNFALVSMLLELPDSSRYLPAVTDVLRVLLLVVKSMGGTGAGAGAASKRSETVVARSIAVLEGITDVVRNRLTTRVREGTAELGEGGNVAATLAEELAGQFEGAAERQKNDCVAGEMRQRARNLIAEVGDLEDFATSVREYAQNIGARVHASSSSSSASAGPGVRGEREKSAARRMGSAGATGQGRGDGGGDDGSGTWMQVNPADSWQGWKRPVVNWLLKPSWLEVGELRSKYESVDDYVLQLRQLWTMLTFYWGAAAFWPRCMKSMGGGGKGGAGDGGKACGTPLFTQAGGQGYTCTMRRANGARCGRPASWRCNRGHHAEQNPHCATCDTCLQWRQSALSGSPSTHCSTDVYDATVAREDDGRSGGMTVYKLKNLRSRKPPTIDPNWGTTYRLSAPALVAVVTLQCRGDALQPHHVIQWGEIVDYEVGKDASRREAQHRKDGCMAVRLLNRGDCAALHSECDQPLEVGVHVAVIDLQVFVPEVVSVLNTFTAESFLPNLHSIPFMSSLIGQVYKGRGEEFHHNDHLSAAENIRTAIGCSDVEVVRRLTEEQRAAITARILALDVVKTLYGTQLEAFTNALAHPAHCTQGPPGTGKVRNDKNIPPGDLFILL